MSSATSIKGDFRVKAEATEPEATQNGPAQDGPTDKQPADQGFRPWHFFVLASLVAATVAVILSRQSTPEHLILISFTIGAAGAAAAGFYRTLAPLAVRDASVLVERPTERARAALEREKALVLRSIKELEFDRAMGKVSAKDFDEMSGRLRARALLLMKQVDAGDGGYRELIERELSARMAGRGGKAGAKTARRSAAEVTVSPDAARSACAACGTANDHDAAFCKRCGTKLQAVHA
jgi:hypothetical protein